MFRIQASSSLSNWITNKDKEIFGTFNPSPNESKSNKEDINEQKEINHEIVLLSESNSGNGISRHDRLLIFKWIMTLKWYTKTFNETMKLSELFLYFLYESL